MNLWVPPHFHEMWAAKVSEARELRKKNARLRSRIKVLTHERNQTRNQLKTANFHIRKHVHPTALEARQDHWRQIAQGSIARELTWTARAEKAERQVAFLRNLLHWRS